MISPVNAIVLTLACLALSGCVRLGEAPTYSDRNTLTHAEIREADIPGTAYDVVQRLRPHWLQERDRQPIRVYVDGLAFGATAQSLAQLSATSLRHLEHLAGIEATARFGRGHAGGAIVVQTH